MKAKIILHLVLVLILLAASGVFASKLDKLSVLKKQMQIQEESQPAAEPVQPQTVRLAGEQINWQVISNGGTDAASASFQLQGTSGQTAVGFSDGTSFGLCHGYWVCKSSGGPSYVCGDCNADGTANITDAVYLITYIFGGGPPPNPLAAGDVNCDGSANITDAVYLIQYIFGGGPPPCDPNDDGVPDC